MAEILSKESKNLISIVIPIFNKSKFLELCLKSVSSQVYRNCEFILIDDCSTDDSFRICQEFAEKDPRFVLLKNDTNLGPSLTRNVGLNLCHGKYVLFLDADDTIEPCFVEKMVFNSNEADVLMCMADRIYDNGDKRALPYHFSKSGRYCGIDYWNNFQFVLSSANWNKMYKLSSLRGASFKNIRGPEDLWFNIDVINPDTTIVSVNEVLYHYKKTTNSLSSTFALDESLKDIEAVLALVKKMHLNHYKKNHRLISWLIGNYNLIKKQCAKTQLNIIRKELIKMIACEKKPLFLKIKEIFAILS